MGIRTTWATGRQHDPEHGTGLQRDVVPSGTRDDAGRLSFEGSVPTVRWPPTTRRREGPATGGPSSSSCPVEELLEELLTIREIYVDNFAVMRPLQPVRPACPCCAACPGVPWRFTLRVGAGRGHRGACCRGGPFAVDRAAPVGSDALTCRGSSVTEFPSTERGRARGRELDRPARRSTHVQARAAKPRGGDAQPAVRGGSTWRRVQAVPLRRGPDALPRWLHGGQRATTGDLPTAVVPGDARAIEYVEPVPPSGFQDRGLRAYHGYRDIFAFGLQGRPCATTIRDTRALPHNNIICPGERLGGPGSAVVKCSCVPTATAAPGPCSTTAEDGTPYLAGETTATPPRNPSGCSRLQP